MNSLFETDDRPSGGEDLAAVRRNAGERLRVWKIRAIYSGLALLLSCVSVTQFLDGHWLYPYWESVGKYLVVLSMVLLPVFLYCALLLWGAWNALRNLNTGT